MLTRIFGHGFLGLLLWLVAVAHTLAGVGWARLWYYHLAWWGYIIFVDGLVKSRTGESLLWDRQRAYVFMAAASTCFWFFFELVNLAALNNWHYEGVARVRWLRWLGAHVAFATVLPGVLVTFEFLALRGWPGPMHVRRLTPSTAWYPWFYAAGALMLALPLIWPGLFFPLVWGALVFLLEPLNHRAGAPSLMRDW